MPLRLVDQSGRNRGVEERIPVTRRQFLSAMMGAAFGAALARERLLLPNRAESPGPQVAPAKRQLGVRHFAWVWQFAQDGAPEAISEILSAHGLGVAVKTHDGTDWMATYDKSPHGVSGPRQVERLATHFENLGVPFHAWYVARGIDPRLEAAMCGDVLAAGARSIIIDLEPHPGFWQGKANDAIAFGEELRRLHPRAWISVSIDPRPWLLDQIPLGEFASFSNELAPQIYWDSFNTAANLGKFVLENEMPGREGITPRFLLEATISRIRQFGLLVQPVGQGFAASEESWPQFVEDAFANDAEAVSVWRFGVTESHVWEVLSANPPRPHKYTVQPGDSLSSLAKRWNTTALDISGLNDITDPYRIRIGQKLLVPRGAQTQSLLDD